MNERPLPQYPPAEPGYPLIAGRPPVAYPYQPPYPHYPPAPMPHPPIQPAFPPYPPYPYGRPLPARIERRGIEEVGCPVATIPIVSVENIDGLKTLANCFVHVEETNTTYYVDNRHRVLLMWAGIVEADNYDYAANPLGLRSQQVYDFENNRAIYYDKYGRYRLVSLSDGTEE